MSSNNIVPRPTVLWFAQAMEEKLRLHDKNRGERGWLTASLRELEDKLNEEQEELVSLIRHTSPSEILESAHRIVQEATDVANVAMMIADVANMYEIELWRDKQTVVLRDAMTKKLDTVLDV